jgi:hypothetical protein
MYEEDENVLQSEAQEEVVDPQDWNSWDEVDESEEGDKELEVAEPVEDEEPQKKIQTKEENAEFAKKRRREELDQAKRENEELKAKLAEMEQKVSAKAVEEQITEDLVWKKADEEGVTEVVAKKMLLQELKLKQYEEKEQAKQREQKRAELKGRPFFEALEPDFDRWMQANPHLEPDAVYKFLVGENIERLTNQTTKTAAKRAIADIQDRSKRSHLASDGGQADDIVNVSSVLGARDIEMSQAFGVDPKKIAKYVKTKMKG